MARKKVPDGIQMKIDENRRVCGIIPVQGGIYLEFWSGAVRSTIHLSDDAFHAAIEIYTRLQHAAGKRESRTRKTKSGGE